MAPKPEPKKRKEMALSSQYRLIGRFIVNWNILESKLNTAITALCKLDEIHGLIVTANLNFQTKMHIINTMVDLLSKSKQDSWRKDAEKTLSRVQELNQTWRNMVVHNIIVPVDTKTVQVLKVSAKRKLQYPKIVRTKSDFENVCSELLRLGDRIGQICDDLRGVTTSALAKALATTPTVPAGDLFGVRPALLPTGVTGFGTLGVLGLLNVPSPENEQPTE